MIVEKTRFCSDRALGVFGDLRASLSKLFAVARSRLKGLERALGLGFRV